MACPTVHMLMMMRTFLAIAGSPSQLGVGSPTWVRSALKIPESPLKSQSHRIAMGTAGTRAGRKNIVR